MTHSRKQNSEDGSAGNKFLINEEFIAMLDYCVVTSLSAKSSEGQPFRIFYCERVEMCKALDGHQDRRNWRPALLEVLDGWLRLKARLRAGFCLGPLPMPSQARCRRTTSELNIAPCEALQAVDQTGRLRPHGCGCCSFQVPFNNKYERRSKH